MRIKTFLLPCLLVAFLVSWSANQSAGNNIAITNIVLGGLDNGIARVRFDIGWDNSWRTTNGAANWDAAWVFLKYRINPTNNMPWDHATLASSGHSGPDGCTITASSDSNGVFIYSSAEGIGNTNFTGVSLRWNYSGTSLEPGNTVDVAAIAIEMVYIPQGSFYVGDGASDRSQFEAGSNGPPFKITSENEIVLGGTNSNNLCSHDYANDDFKYSNILTNPAAFPKGYNAFYCMKYELCQGEYANFLSYIQSNQYANRYDANKLGSYRYTISGTWPNITAGAPGRACNFVEWSDCLAYSDWAGLRPMTELEFEKACRGTNYPVLDERAWGGISVEASAYTITNSGLPDEKVNAKGGIGNAAYNVTYSAGPMRAGIMAASLVKPSRKESGASFYGVMQMSDNIWESAITVGNSLSRVFTGLHGDGLLNANGTANVSNWPAGAGVRCSYFSHSSDAMRVSDRRDCSYGFIGSGRYFNRGFRAVHTAP